MKNTELLNAQMNAKKTDSKAYGSKEEPAQLIKTKELKEPFGYVEIKDKGNYIALGYNLIAEVENEEEAIKLIQNKDWKLIINTIATVIKEETKTK